MATYCSSDDLIAVLGGDLELQRLSDKANLATDDDAVAEALATATAKIDEYATGTPGTDGTTAGALWSTVPQQAKSACEVLAIYYLAQGVWGFVSQERKAAYDLAIK